MNFRTAAGYILSFLSIVLTLDKDFDDINANGVWDPGEDLVISSKQDKFITIGGAVTEVIFNLGFGNSVIAVDQSSTFPKKVKDLPEIGYVRMISSERVLSKFPKKIFSSKDLAPKTAIKQFQESPVDFKIYNAPKNIIEIYNLIDQLSSDLNVQDLGVILKDKIKSDVASIDNISSQFKRKPKIVFFMNPAAGSYVGAGSGTVANYLIELMGGENIFSDEFASYQKVSKESIFMKNPDIILVAAHNSGESPSDHFSKNSEFKSLKAVRKNNIIEISMSDLTMGTSFASNALSIITRLNYDSK